MINRRQALGLISGISAAIVLAVRCGKDSLKGERYIGSRTFGSNNYNASGWPSSDPYGGSNYGSYGYSYGGSSYGTYGNPYGYNYGNGSFGNFKRSGLKQASIENQSLNGRLSIDVLERLTRFS